MAQSIPFGARSTADQVLAGVDLTRKRMVVTGCESGIGLETMKALCQPLVSIVFNCVSDRIKGTSWTLIRAIHT
jgi:hypothetical protein